MASVGGELQKVHSIMRYNTVNSMATCCINSIYLYLGDSVFVCSRLYQFISCHLGLQVSLKLHWFERVLLYSFLLLSFHEIKSHLLIWYENCLFNTQYIYMICVQYWYSSSKFVFYWKLFYNYPSSCLLGKTEIL